MDEAHEEETAREMSLYETITRAWRRGVWLTPWRMPRQNSDKALLKGLGEYMRIQPGVAAGLQKLGFRGHNVRVTSRTILLLEVLWVAGAIAVPFRGHADRGWIGIFVGLGMFSLSACIVGFDRMREVLLPRTHIRLHGWAQVVGLLVALTYLGWTIAWFV